MRTRTLWMVGLLTTVSMGGFAFPGAADPLDCVQTRQDNVDCLKDEAGDPAQLGTLYCGDVVGSCGEVGFRSAPNCGANSMWRVEGFVVDGGVAQDTIVPFVACDQATVDSCAIHPAERFCSSGTPEDANAGSLNCGYTVQPGETAEVDVECEDPPMPGKSGWLVQRRLRTLEDGTQTVLSQVTQWLPPLSE